MSTLLAAAAKCPSCVISFELSESGLAQRSFCSPKLFYDACFGSGMNAWLPVFGEKRAITKACSDSSWRSSSGARSIFGVILASKS